jgi:hypothetical protein
MIHITFMCEGAAGHARLGECNTKEVLYLDSYGSLILPDAVEFLREMGWSFRPVGDRLVVRCPKCEVLRVRRNEARAKRQMLARERKHTKSSEETK